MIELPAEQLGIAIETYTAEMNHQRQLAKQKGVIVVPVVVIGST